jgi:hypothetical protein
MNAPESTTVTLDLSKELTPAELASFQSQAEKAGHSLQDHLREIVFGLENKKEGAA